MVSLLFLRIFTLSSLCCGMVMAKPWPYHVKAEDILTEPVSISDLDSIRSVDLEVDAAGLHLLVGNGEGDVVELHYLHWSHERDTWSKLERLPTEPHAIKGLNFGNPPRLSLCRDRVYVIWQKPGSGWGGRGPMVGLSSDKNTLHWCPLPLPKPSLEGGDQGFYDLVATDDGELHLVWLGKVKATDHKGLFYARSRDGGDHWTTPHCVSQPTCMCCWNSLTLSKRGQLATLYRQAVPRDMAVALLPLGSTIWRELGSAGAFSWDFRGCPHVGGALVMDDRSGDVHAAVWTGKADKQGLYVMGYDSSKKNWLEPVPMGGPSAKHMDMTKGPSGQLFLVWDEHVAGTSSIMMSFGKGAVWTEPRRLSGDQYASHPTCVMLGGELHVIWSSEDDSKRCLSHFRMETGFSTASD